MKIGILGGTFNPMHIGHMEMAIQAKKHLSLDEVWIMPCGTPPHKEGDIVLSRIHRFKICELFCEGEEGIVVSYEEYNRLTPNYSYQTLAYLRENHPHDEFVFLIGQDSLLYFDSWKSPQKIVKYATIGVFMRNSHKGGTTDYNQKICLEKIASLKEMIGGDYILIPYEPTDISSTQIRAYIADHPDPEAVREYILKYTKIKACDYIMSHDLYKTPVKYDYNAIEKELKKQLKPSRYTHTLGVCYTACALAMRWGVSVDKCRIAGLLHDCAKYMSKEELFDYASAHDITLSEAEKIAPQLIHAKVGAFMAKDTYGITDEDVLHAISVHTTGCPDMNLYDEIIFVSDYIEPNREPVPHLEEIRNMAFSDLEMAVRMILKNTIFYLKETNAYIDPTTQETLDYYEKEQ